MKARVTLLLLVLLTAGFCVQVEWQDINIKLGEKGSVKVTERIMVSFENETEEAAFDAMSNAHDLASWQELVPGLQTHVTGAEEPLIITSGKSGGLGIISLEYPAKSLSPSREGRYLVYQFPANRLSFYSEEERTLRIPAKTTLAISVPNNDKIKITGLAPTPVIPTYIANGVERVTEWRGPLSTPEFYFKYKVEETLSEAFSLQDFAEQLGRFLVSNPAYTITLAVFLGLIIVYRREIFGLLSEGSVSEEEIELPKE